MPPFDRRRAVSLLAATVVAFSAGSAAAGTYYAGAAVRSITPGAAMIASGRFYLGGYGFGDGKVLDDQVAVPGMTGRAATGVLDGVSVRAVALSDGAKAIVLAQVETQGYFVAYKQGPFGLVDIRRDAADRIAAIRRQDSPAISAGAILVNSNHTHGGPDTVGVWGGVPTAYLRFVHDQAVDAIVDAYEHLRPATLAYGTADGAALLANQFGYDPANQSLDREVRVLQAKDVDGNVMVTYANFSAHPTVLGSDNTLVTADYTGVLSEMLAARYGGVGFDQVATLGRTQPADRNCTAPLSGESDAACRLREYAARVLVKVEEALAASAPLDAASPVVDLHSYLMEDQPTNALLFGLAYAGAAAGVPILRSVAPPWFTGTLLGAPSFSGRIGDVLVSGGPGEMYPQIVETVHDLVPAAGHLNVGTAGDFLGYIIAPVTAYPEPIRRSLFTKGDPQDPTTWKPSPVDNDNYFFNVSHTFGERLTCSLLRGAGEVLGAGATTYWTEHAPCPAFANDLLVPADADTVRVPVELETP